MAATVRKVIRKQGQPAAQAFPFTRQMIPVLSQDNAPRFLRDYRQQAWETFEGLPLPDIHMEAWRRTELRSLEAASFRLPDGGSQHIPAVPRRILRPLVGRQPGGQIVLTPQESFAQASTRQIPPELTAKGVIFTDLKTAEHQFPQILEKVLGSLVRPGEGKFAAMAAALAQTGVLVYVPHGVQVEQPLHSVLWGAGAGLAYFSHLLVYLEPGAALTYVHETTSPTEAGRQSLHAGIVEIQVADGANLRFVELQSWGGHVWNFNHERARIGRDASLDWITAAVGSRLTKSFLDLDLIESGATGRMSGFYFTDGNQHMDLDTQQNHLAPHTTSDLLYKGALKGSSRAVWQGMIHVAPNAQKTDGYQANRNLVLSSKARADSIPGLEILANDVRCTHGATVSRIDPEQLFFLQARGISRLEAESLIVEGFFEPVLQRIPFAGVRGRLREAIKSKINHKVEM
jgi:Fe-S cluster assembly protein SufD